MRVQKLWPVGMFLGLAGCGGCPAETVNNSAAAGVARLTIRNVASIATIINKDTKCGFASPAVLASPTITGDVGGQGAVTWTVTDCEYDGGDGTEFTRDCHDVYKTASGKFKITATKTVTGTITGNPLSPVIPDGPNAFKAAMSKLEFTDFKIEASNSDSILTIQSGSGTGTLERLLAVAVPSGACAFATDNARIKDLVLTDAKMKVTTKSSDVVATVKSTNLTAYIGLWLDRENDLEGNIKLTSQVTPKGALPMPPLPPSQEEDVELPVAGDTRDLDPEYDREEYLTSFSCDAEMAKPLSYMCANLTPLVADGAARLTVKAFGTVASLLDANTECGFSAPAVLGAGNAQGTVGAMGAITFTATNCTLTLPANTELGADCDGVKTLAGGSVTVSGSKTITGWFTGNPLQPVVPATDSPVTMELTLTPTNFKVGSSADASAITLKSGMLSGTLQPRTAVGAATGACSVSTGMARFTNLTWMDGVAAVTSSSGTFDLPIASGTLNAVNGTWGQDSNVLYGELTVGGTSYPVPHDQLGLNPAFTQAAFDHSWQCNPALLNPVSHSCSFVGPLSQGTARLTPRTVGAVLSLVNANTSCGFSSPAVGGRPAFTGQLGEDNSTATFTIPWDQPCEITLPADSLVSTDCTGVTTKVGGTVRVAGTKVVTGFRTGDPMAPIVPTSRDPATFFLSMEFDNFKVESSASTSSLTVKSGVLTASITPRTGLDTTTGTCSISTPVVSFDHLTYQDAVVNLVSDGKLFTLPIFKSDLNAQSGTKGEVSNTLTGNITVMGATVPIPINPADGTLDPEYDATAFTASYICTPHLLIPPGEAQCSFRAVLAQGAARLLIKNVGTANKMTDSNTTCGFSAMSVLGAPTAVHGNPGETGDITWTATACTTGPLPDMVIAQDCTGALTHAAGKVVASGTKTVRGVRNTNPPIVPVARDAAEFAWTDLAFTNFTAYTLAPGETAPAGKLVFSGNVTATVDPIAGQSATNAGVYSVGTPVAGFTHVKVTGGQATLVSGPKTFKFTITDSDLAAFNGIYNGAGNSLSGTITVDNILVTLPINPADPALDPAFSQATFDASYVCTPDLAELVPSAD